MKEGNHSAVYVRPLEHSVPHLGNVQQLGKLESEAQLMEEGSHSAVLERKQMLEEWSRVRVLCGSACMSICVCMRFYLFPIQHLY